MWASAVVALRLQTMGSGVVVQGARLLHSSWDLPRSRSEAMSSALAGGFLPLSQPGKLRNSTSKKEIC